MRVHVVCLCAQLSTCPVTRRCSSLASFKRQSFNSPSAQAQASVSAPAPDSVSFPCLVPSSARAPSRWILSNIVNVLNSVARSNICGWVGPEAVKLYGLMLA